MKSFVLNWFKEHKEELNNLSEQIWQNPEVGLKEEFASSLLKKYLAKHGFTIESNVANMSTAFSAKWGEGKPVIAYLAEYDALLGVSQAKNETIRKPIKGKKTGHGCGHNLLGAGAVGAGVALKEYLKSNNKKGTVIVYGCPAEETFVGKTFMAKEGVFNNADVALTWHPDRVNMVADERWESVIVSKFNFYGTASHAATEPENGRSALDAVELMATGVNFMREHIIDKARIHHVITSGGEQPNVVPSYAQVWYYVRAPKWQQAKQIYERVKNNAKGAALMTDTELEVKFITASPDILANDILNELLSDCMQELPNINFSEQEYEFAKKIKETFHENQEDLIRERLKIAGYKGEIGDKDRVLFTSKVEYKGLDPDVAGSSDIGSVSWLIPTAQVLTTCNPFGTADHSWQYISCAGSSIGQKGMLYASQILTLAGIKLIQQPSLIKRAKKRV